MKMTSSLAAPPMPSEASRMNAEFELAEMLRMIVNRATSPIYFDSTAHPNVMLRAALIDKARDLLTRFDNLTTPISREDLI